MKSNGEISLNNYDGLSANSVQYKMYIDLS